MALHHRKILEAVCTLYCHLKDSCFESDSDFLVCFKRCFSQSPSPPIYIDHEDFANPAKSHKIGNRLKRRHHRSHLRFLPPPPLLQRLHQILSSSNIRGIRSCYSKKKGRDIGNGRREDERMFNL
ncbi:uncharacterized protein G2W53_032522 [Senna tora]|uniref:Uncharacterized protein n=1 Tax=Senna tora TaxID=362788 RepID=A0A834SZ84_9FABA|nr:uncharacterized protein G2W53_032522 [Senna tora]